MTLDGGSPIDAATMRALNPPVWAPAGRSPIDTTEVSPTIAAMITNNGRRRLVLISREYPAIHRRSVCPMQRDTKFGWLSPVIGNRWSDHQSIVIYQEKNILPTALEHFDSLWVADHFYGFDAKTDPFLEAWTTLTWLAAKFPNVLLCHHVLGHGYRPPALTAKMAATLQTLSEGRFMLGIGAGWQASRSTKVTAMSFRNPSVRFGRLEDVIHICRAMWTQDSPSYKGKYFEIRRCGCASRCQSVECHRICTLGRKANESVCPWSALRQRLEQLLGSRRSCVDSSTRHCLSVSRKGGSVRRH